MSDVTNRSQVLIDSCFDWLDPKSAEAARAAVGSSPELRAQSANLEHLLNELEAYEAPAPAADLAERVLARIEESETLIPFPISEAASAIPSGNEREFSGHPVLSLRELITIAACITLFVGIFVPGYYRAQAISKRTVCQENQRQIYAGFKAYAEATANGGFLPYAGAVPGGTWLRVRYPGVVRASNTRHAYLAVKEGYVPARVFVCPGFDRAIPMVMENYRKAIDFAEPANCTYSFQNQNIPDPLPLSKLSPGLVILADPNPYFSGDAVHNLDPSEPSNSYCHDVNAGQNVVYVDGHTNWATKPTVGVNADNIYLAGTLRHYTGTEVPLYPTDSFLVP